MRVLIVLLGSLWMFYKAFSSGYISPFGMIYIITGLIFIALAFIYSSIHSKGS